MWFDGGKALNCNEFSGGIYQRNESEVRARHYQLPGCIPQYAIDFYRELESPSVIRQFVELGRERSTYDHLNI